MADSQNQNSTQNTIQDGTAINGSVNAQSSESLSVQEQIQKTRSRVGRVVVTDAMVVMVVLVTAVVAIADKHKILLREPFKAVLLLTILIMLNLVAALATKSKLLLRVALASKSEQRTVINYQFSLLEYRTLDNW